MKRRIIGFIIISSLLIVISCLASYIIKNNVVEKDRDEKDFYGVYENGHDKLVIKEYNAAGCFEYIIIGNINYKGIGVIKGNKADSSYIIDKGYDNYYFIFNYKKSGIEVDYKINKDGYEVKASKGLYKKVAEYSEDNLYDTIVGDKKYLDSAYSGRYQNNDLYAYAIQLEEDIVEVIIMKDSVENVWYGSFEKKDNKFISRIINLDDNNSYELEYLDNSFFIKCVGNTCDKDSTYELEYTKIGPVTEKKVLYTFYSFLYD